MKMVQINTSCGVGSTGKICVSISELLNEKKIENYILFSTLTNGYTQGISCTDRNYIRFQALKSRILGNYGFNSNFATKRMIAHLERIKPDVVHLHNIHGHDCNLETLLGYLRQKKIKVYWTFHDCWAFTGYCPHFVAEKCEKWKAGCHACNVYRSYSWFADRSATLYERKKRSVEGLDLTVITPSQWLADQVRQSFLKDFPIKVIHNGIDLSIFQPTESTFREKHSLQDKKIVLGVSFGWGYKKGLDVFVRLARELDAEYQVVLVGTNSAMDKDLPSNIISVRRTQNQQELAQIYSTADVFVNATREDTFPTVNMEALACGTPVVTFRTGGSPEMIKEGTNGFVVACNDISGIKSAIINACGLSHAISAECVKSAQKFDMNERFKEYVNLYVLGKI